MTVAGLAKRWGVSRDRIRSLMDQGVIPGAFRIPAAGRFGARTVIPLASVQALEEAWMVDGDPVLIKKRPRQSSQAILRHFPELSNPADEPGGQCPANDPH